MFSVGQDDDAVDPPDWHPQDPKYAADRWVAPDPAYVMGDLERLKWQCRRGSLELDLLMTRFLDDYYPNEPTNLKHAFERLIEYSDATLYDLFTGKIQAEDHDIATIVNKILE